MAKNEDKTLTFTQEELGALATMLTGAEISAHDLLVMQHNRKADGLLHRTDQFQAKLDMIRRLLGRVEKARYRGEPLPKIVDERFEPMSPEELGAEVAALADTDQRID